METVELDVDEVVAETDLAFLVRAEDGEEYWIPKKLIQSGDVSERGDSGTLEIPEWFAEREGIV